MKLAELAVAVSDVEHLARQMYRDTARRRGRPAKEVQRQVICAAGSAIQAASGRIIETRWTEKSEKVARFEGAEGEVLYDFMRLVVPRIRERTVVETWRSCP